MAIRSNPDIKGDSCVSQQHKCALFTDDMLLFIMSQLITTPNIFRILQEFFTISGLNVSKSLALNISGIKLSSNMNKLYIINYFPMFRKLEEDLQNWSKCGLFWLGRINEVKMTLLPRLLYLFRFLPIPINKTLISKFQSKVISFVWRKRDTLL